MTITARQPARFGRVWQITSIPWLRGTETQRQAVRERFSPTFGSLFDRMLYRLDVAVNVRGRHHLTVEFHKNMTAPGNPSPSGISLSAAMGPAGIREVAGHECGHLTDFYLITDEDRGWFMREMGRATWPGAWESWAEAVREWIESDGEQWAKLTPILLGEVA